MDESRPQCGHAEYIKTVDLMANSYKQEFQVFSASSLCCTCFERTVISLDLQVLESHRVCQSFLQHRHHPTDMASLRREVLGGYKRLMRARLSAFKGDTTMLGASKEQLRIEFVKNQGVTDPAKIAGFIKGIKEVEEMLLCNIAQARKNERGNFAVNVAPKGPRSEAGKESTIELEHIGGTAGDLPDDITVTKSPRSSTVDPAKREH